jgi:type I restriction enzyme, S subunit
MKESGLPWLGMVPEHWDIRRLKSIAEMLVSNVDKHSNDDEVPVRLCNYVDVYKNDRIHSKMTFMRATATTDEINRFQLQPGDVLITKDSETWNDIGVPALVKDTDPDLVCGYHLAILRPCRKTVMSEYLFRALQSNVVAYQFHIEANGVTRYGLSHSSIESIRLPIPPLLEQSLIVRFLDHVDRRIRRYVRTKQKVIKLLEEQKQTIINRTVTRGLDHNVCLKPSGIEWLGDVPKDWSVLPFTRIAVHIADYRGATPTKTETGNFLVTARNVRKGWIDYETSKEYVDEKDYLTIMRRGLPKVGDLLLTMEAPLGNAALVDREDIALAQRVVKFRFDPEIVEPQYVLINVLSLYFQNQLLCRGTGSTAIGIKASKLPQLKLLVPSITEQRALLNYINNECRPLEIAKEQTESEINLLMEYRTRLIADVVTGKLDVRNVVAQLPDESELFDDIDAEISSNMESIETIDEALEPIEA